MVVVAQSGRALGPPLLLELIVLLCELGVTPKQLVELTFLLGVALSFLGLRRVQGREFRSEDGEWGWWWWSGGKGGRVTLGGG